MVAPNTLFDDKFDVWGQVNMQCTQREQAHQDFFEWGTLLGQKTQSPRESMGNQGKHPKSREILGHFSSID